MTTSGLDLSTELAPQHPVGLKLANPIMIASGTFGWDGYGRGLLGEDLDGQVIHPVARGSQLPLPEIPGTIGRVDFRRLGAVVAKTVTMHSRQGNPEPRWFPQSWRRAQEIGESIYLNSIGLTNPGISSALEEKAPTWVGWKLPVILSIAGESIEEFGVMADMADGTPGVAALELNLSCPNVENGSSFSHTPDVAAETVGRVKRSTSLPVIPKLSPNVPDIVPIAKAVVGAGADAITIANTMPAMGIDVDTRSPVLGGITGGVSGPALHPIVVALVYRAAQAVDVPIIGVGGVFSTKDALEFMMAGATAVQVGSANLADFWAPLEVLDGIQAYLGEQGISNISEIIGAVRNSPNR